MHSESDIQPGGDDSGGAEYPALFLRKGEDARLREESKIRQGPQ